MVKFRADQLGKFPTLVKDSRGPQRIRNDSIPDPLRKAGGWGIQSAALHQLMAKFGLGGDKWIRQAVFGFPTTGIMGQVGVFPHSDKANPQIRLSFFGGRR